MNGIIGIAAFTLCALVVTLLSPCHIRNKVDFFFDVIFEKTKKKKKRKRKRKVGVKGDPRVPRLAFSGFPCKRSRRCSRVKSPYFGSWRLKETSTRVRSELLARRFSLVFAFSFTCFTVTKALTEFLRFPLNAIILQVASEITARQVF